MEQFRLNSEKMLKNECEEECRKQIEMIKSFLVDELLIRCANVIVENKELPRALRENDHFQRMESNYEKVVKNLRKRNGIKHDYKSWAFLANKYHAIYM